VLPGSDYPQYSRDENVSALDRLNLDANKKARIRLESDVRRIDPETGQVRERLEMPSGVGVFVPGSLLPLEDDLRRFADLLDRFGEHRYLSAYLTCSIDGVETSLQRTGARDVPEDVAAASTD
jgi:hypothetical protein